MIIVQQNSPNGATLFRFYLAKVTRMCNLPRNERRGFQLLKDVVPQSAFAWPKCACAATSANDQYAIVADDASGVQCEMVYPLLKVMTLHQLCRCTILAHVFGSVKFSYITVHCKIMLPI